MLYRSCELEKRKVRRTPAGAEMPKEKIRRELVVIGGSAGALEATRELLSALPQDFPAPIVLVIHIPGDYPSYLETILGRAGPLRAKEVHDSQRMEAGNVYIAPPDHHLLVEDSRVEVSRGPKENRHRPAIDPLFRTAARAYGPGVIGVVLSGSLDDGSSGLMAVKKAGGLACVQSAKEAASPEMPMRAKQYADADCELTVAELASLLVQETSRGKSARAGGGEIPMAREIGKEGEKARLESQANKDKQGQPSAFACPDCGGVLWELQEGDLLRFRCRVGHAYTADTLRGAMAEGVEQALWASMRAMEEKSALLRRLAERIGEKRGEEYQEEAKGYDKHVETIRHVLVTNQRLDDAEENAAD